MFRNCMKMYNTVDENNNKPQFDPIWRENVEPFIVTFIVGSYICLQALAFFLYFDSFIMLAILFTTGAVMQFLATSQVSLVYEETRAYFKKLKIYIGLINYVLVVATLASALKLSHCWTYGFAGAQILIITSFGYSIWQSVRRERRMGLSGN